MQSPFGFAPRRAAKSPFMQPARANGPTAAARDSKTYVVDVPIYAAPEGTAQDAWNKLSHKFTITSPDGTAKTYEVSQNMANPATAAAKIYPATGVTDSDKNSYFPVNVWGFGISPRNLKQYNYQMLLDSLVWNQYRVRGVQIKFVPLMGAMQPGQFEAVLLNNAQIMPSAPFTNQTNSCSFSATQQNAFEFSVNNETVGTKNMKSVQDTFDSVADFGILWFRTAGFSNLTAITEVAKLQIKVSVDLSNYSPSPYAQLIGPWIEAGYPIDGDGTVVQTTTNPTITGTEILDTDTSKDVVDIARLARGRDQKPRWYIVPTEKDTKICSLQGSSAVAHKETVHKNFLRKIGANADEDPKFPLLVQDKFDGAVSGKTFLDDVKAGDDVHIAEKPTFPTAPNPELYIDTPDLIVYEASPKGQNPRFQLAYYPSESAYNSYCIAQGGVGVDYTGSDENAGSRVGVTFKFVTSFAPGTVPLIGEFKDAYYQPSSGYTAGIGTAVAADTDALSDTDAELGSFLSKLCAFGAAGLKTLVNEPRQKKEDELNGPLLSAAANFFSAGVNKAKNIWRSIVNDGDLAVQAAAIEVPENAAFCEIGAYPEGSVASAYAKGFFECMPQAAKYGLQKLSSSKLTDDKARLTISGQVNTLHQAIIAIQGTAPTKINQLPYAVDVKESLVLAASRVNPAEDPAGFYDTAIPITSLLDSISQTSASGSMYLNAASGSGGRFVFTKTTENEGRIRADNTSVAGFGYAPVFSANPCNFTVPFPDYLYDAKSQGLTKVNVGDKIYFSIIKSSAVTYSHVINETVGTYTFFVLPNIAEGTDKTTPDQAGHQYILKQDPAAPFKITAITQGDALTETVYMAEDGERRFTFECTTPNDNGEEKKAGPKKAIRCTSV